MDSSLRLGLRWKLQSGRNNIQQRWYFQYIRGGGWEVGAKRGNGLFQFDQWDSIKTTYGGNVAGNAMVGTMSTFAGLNGCWYAIRAGSTTMLAKERKPEYDASGNKAKQ
jgi:hypothetical protein